MRGLALKSALPGRIWGTVDAIRRYWPPRTIPERSVVTALDSTLNSDALARYTGKGLRTFESHFLFGQRGELTCTGHHAELIITGDHAVPESLKSSSMDRMGGVGGNTEVGFGGEEDEEEEEVVDRSQQGGGETSFPNSQDLFLTLDLDPVPPEPTQGGLPDPEGGEGTSVQLQEKPVNMSGDGTEILQGHLHKALLDVLPKPLQKVSGEGSLIPSSMKGKPIMAARHKRDPVWEYFNEVPLLVGQTGMCAKCKQCNKEMQGLVARRKQHHERRSVLGGSCVEDDERNMSEHAGSSG
ncbi:hypothetical protein UY3_12071 [Chelonia mydas]|uniref:BED-type domain-containing protein n=1 Tax=Chelonia mydas TaxID=8469 RepID=M7B5L4_CHEMY|nr:hypothetical protein UY3_12071 [Chelonia mydas]